MDLVVKRFEELSLEEIYEILKVRVSVFVVKQNCAYQELDDKDQYSYHVFLKDDMGIKAYLRVIDKGVSFEDVSIGRVLTLERGCGLGNRILSELMVTKLLTECYFEQAEDKIPLDLLRV